MIFHEKWQGKQSALSKKKPKARKLAIKKRKKSFMSQDDYSEPVVGVVSSGAESNCVMSGGQKFGFRIL